MCEILICTKNLGNTGQLGYDSLQPKQGDVIALKPDGWGWSAAELGQTDHPNFPKHNFFRVVKLPNVTVAQASRMLAPEVDQVGAAHPSPYLQFRAFFLDVSKIPIGALKTYWNDDARAQGFVTVALTASQLNNFVTQRTPVLFT